MAVIVGGTPALEVRLNGDLIDHEAFGLSAITTSDADEEAGLCSVTFDADQLAASGAIDDAAFAASRARGLARAGKSARAVAAHLQAHGVASDLVREAVPEDAERELAAALSFARRRRIGPFRRTEELEPEEALRELGMLARAGYPREVAGTALRMDADEATDRINRARLP